MARTARKRANALRCVVLIQIDCLLHEQRVLVQALLLLLPLMCCDDIAGFLCREGAKSVVLWVAEHPQDGTRADRPVVGWVREPTRAGSVRLSHRIVVLRRRLRPVVRGIDELVVGASVQQIGLDVLNLQLVGVAALLQRQILTTIFAHQPVQ